MHLDKKGKLQLTRFKISKVLSVVRAGIMSVHSDINSRAISGKYNADYRLLGNVP